MTRDTRITVSILLLYFLNGFINIFGPSKAFMPLVFLDSFLLTLLCLLFTVLPPFHKGNLVFIVFGVLFLFKGLFGFRYINNLQLELAIEIGFTLLCGLFYFLPVWYTQFRNAYFMIPFIIYLATLVCAWYQVKELVIVWLSGAAFFMQVYLLARPDLVERLPLPLKRFYLLTIALLFFDFLRFLFVMFALGHAIS